MFSTRSQFSDRAARSSAVLGLAFGLTTLMVVGAEAQIPTDKPVVEQGASPIEGGQTEGITNNPVVGAINTLAPHPTNAAILYAGSVNGGVWRTTDATSHPPSWERLTSEESSQSIGVIAFDPTDGTHQTLVAGIGRFSSFAGRGGARTGLLRTTDGVTFSEIAGMEGRNIVGVAPRGATIVAAVDVADAFTCGNIGIWRSTNTGTTWSQVTNGIPQGTVDALASDPSSTSTLYASIVFGNVCSGTSNGLYKSTDTGASWTKVSDATIDALLVDSSATNVDIAVGASSVFVSIVPGTGQLGGVFQSTNGGTSWTQMDLPQTFEMGGAGGFVGIHAGSQGSIHSSLAVDPTDADIVYIGGDRQPIGFNDQGSFPNSIGAQNFSGRLFRGDAGAVSGSQWTALTHSGTASNSSPHADSRVLVFGAGGRLYEGDDGGVYERTSPRTSTGDWIDKNGDLQVTEQHNTGLDTLNNIILSGNQDTGSGEQPSTGATVWSQISQGDGGDAVAGPAAAANQVVRYSSFQNLGAFRRRTFGSSNNLLLTEFPALTVISGAAFDPKFTTPVAVNLVDASRLVFGGDNGVYESFDRGDTMSQISTTIVTHSGLGGGSIAAGAGANADLLFVAGCILACGSSGDGVDGIYRRNTSGGALSHVLGDSTTTFVGVTIDPDDANQIFAVDTEGGAYQSTNGGTTWSAITGDLATLDLGSIHSVEYLNSPAGDGLLVGANRGIALATAGDSFSVWNEYGTGLPHSPVYEMTYDDATDTLVIGTLGSGTFVIEEVSVAPDTSIFTDGFESGDTSLWSATIP